MKNFITLIITVCLFLFNCIAVAEIRSSDLESKVTVTEKQQLLDQVDFVSLYFSSEKVAYEPQLTPDAKIKVSIIVLDKALIDNRNEMQNLVAKQIAVFKRELQVRLHKSAPMIASNFEADKDLIFEIVETPRRIQIASVVNGNWQWLIADSNSSEGADGGGSAYASKKNVDKEKMATLDQQKITKKAGCNCPALRIKK